MALPLVAVGAGLAIGSAALDVYEKLSGLDELDRQVRLSKLATRQRIRSEQENEKRRALLRQTRLNTLTDQMAIAASALNVIGGASLDTINATLAHGATLEQAWDSARAAETLASLQFKQSEVEAAAKAQAANLKIGAAGAVLKGAEKVVTLERMGKEADG